MSAPDIAATDSRPDPPLPEHIVCVFGGSQAPPESPAYEAALSVGGKLAGLGYAIANGGYGGTMEASARGAKAAGGLVIGVTCSIWRSPPNEFLDWRFVAPDLTDRLGRLVTLGRSGYVVLPGANGTLSELACVWERKHIGDLSDRPLVFFGSYWQPLIEIITSAQPKSARHLAVVRDAEELERHFPPHRIQGS